MLPSCEEAMDSCLRRFWVGAVSEMMEDGLEGTSEGHSDCDEEVVADLDLRWCRLPSVLDCRELRCGRFSMSPNVPRASATISRSGSDSGKLLLFAPFAFFSI